MVIEISINGQKIYCFFDNTIKIQKEENIKLRCLFLSWENIIKRRFVTE
jgi:uncharacterized protein YecE (DUF72 family)